jgi:hypothetical protein
MLLIEFQPAFFAVSCREHAVTPSNVSAAIVQRGEIIERFEFKSFFDRQPDENAMAACADTISQRKQTCRELQRDARSTATKRWSRQTRQNPTAPYRVIEIVALVVRERTTLRDD